MNRLIWLAVLTITVTAVPGGAFRDAGAASGTGPDTLRPFYWVDASDMTVDLAYNETENVYLGVYDLVKYPTANGKEGDIYCHVVTTAGSAGTALAIDTSTDHSLYPKVAWGTGSQFLVVWQNKVVGASYFTIRGQFVTVTSGTPALSGSSFNIYSPAFNVYTPDVGYSTTTDKYFVVLQLDYGSSSQKIILGRSITSTGTQGALKDFGGSIVGLGYNFEHPTVSPRRDSEAMAVGYIVNLGTQRDVYVSGMNLSTESVISLSQTVVSNSTQDEQYTALGGTTGTSYEYLTWSRNTGTTTANWDVHARRISVTTSGVTLGTAFSVEVSTGRTSYRSCAARTSGKLIIVYQDSTTIPPSGTWNIRSKTYSTATDPPTLQASTDVSTSANDQGKPTVAMKPSDSTALIGFHDNNSGYNTATLVYTGSTTTHTVGSSSVSSGTTSGATGTSYTYTAATATCALGHAVSYSFDWGDATSSAYSTSTSASHSWSAEGDYEISVATRCSAGVDGVGVGLLYTVTITAAAHTVSTPSTPSGSTSTTVNVSGTYATGGATCSSGHALSYRFDWGDTTGSYGSASQSKTWTTAGTYSVKAMARCNTDTSIVSSWSSALSVTVTAAHTLSTPSVPTGSNGTAGTSYTYTTGGSTDSLSHTIQYQFDWGDGTTSSYSSSTSASHIWSAAGTYSVKARSKCSANTETSWSTALSVTMGAPPADTEAPSISITSPTTSPTYSTASTPITISGTASDNVGVSLVSWENWDTGGDGNATGTTSWSISVPLAAGDNEIDVTAEDAAGNSTTVTITVTYTGGGGGTPPTISIESPTTASTYSTNSASVALGGVATDDVAVTTVTWSNAATFGSGSATGTSAWSATVTLTVGSNVITVRAFDAAGNSTTDSITVTYSLPSAAARKTKGSCGSIGLDLLLLPAMAWAFRRRKRLDH